jgi:hypothetical protein
MRVCHQRQEVCGSNLETAKSILNVLYARLLPAANCGPHAVPGSRAAARANGAEFVSESGFQLRGVQLAQGREGGEGFLAQLVGEQRLSTSEFEGRLRALGAVASEKLRPALVASDWR